MEAVPAPTARPISEIARSALECGSEVAAFGSPSTEAVAGESTPGKAVAGATALQGAFGAARSGETLRQSEWREVLLEGGCAERAAARLKAEHNLPYADCFAGALAQARRAALVTSDRGFERAGSLVRTIRL